MRCCSPRQCLYFLGWHVKFMKGKYTVKLRHAGGMGDGSNLGGERCLKKNYGEILGHRGAFHEHVAYF